MTNWRKVKTARLVKETVDRVWSACWDFGCRELGDITREVLLAALTEVATKDRNLRDELVQVIELETDEHRAALDRVARDSKSILGGDSRADRLDNVRLSLSDIEDDCGLTLLDIGRLKADIAEAIGLRSFDWWKVPVNIRDAVDKLERRTEASKGDASYGLEQLEAF
ncbi:polyhydroxyalkanoate synthesis regulator phasin [Rhizobium sp. BK316]|uniref:hypothetical protein n=1 Tax=Rhizobium sp. BK316 TaxID=2587053 RepID=UPI001618AA7E|nr:hypothetical protein [Rhizobium sp. BK316]MBB3410682.1 polyhydroxyalkanoate synthesis regulator phasin [Rhizobium sp. BK316]